jgi:tetratricopeptide (TPR) repeat protein
MLWRQARARLLARRGNYEEAVRLASEAVDIGETTEGLNSKADARADLGEVFTIARRPQKAAEALEQALVRFEAKENLVMAARIKERLEALRAEAR